MRHEVFVLGCTRSGTSAVANALRQAGYAGLPGEGHLTSLLPALRHTIAEYRALKHRAGPDDAVSRFPWGALDSSIDAQLRGFYDSLHGNKCFVDKTPYHFLPHPVADIRRVWPNARILYCQRNGIDCVNSQVRKFAKINFGFERACLNWACAAASWAAVEESARDISLVVEHQKLLRDPGATAAEIAAFLALEPDEASGLANALLTEFPEHIAAKATAATWTTEERVQFIRICGESMQRLGYGLHSLFSEARTSSALLLTRGSVIRSAVATVQRPEFFTTEDGDNVVLHPPMPGGESRVTFPGLPTQGFRRFITGVQVRSPLAQGVRFWVELTPSQGNREKETHHIDVAAGFSKPWIVPLPDGAEQLEVSLITSMPPGSVTNQYAWATFAAPRLV